jgi:hypothetical protein
MAVRIEEHPGNYRHLSTPFNSENAALNCVSLRPVTLNGDCS